MGEILIIVGFLIGCYGGCILSLPNAINDSNGNPIQAKQTKFTLVIALGSVLVLIGQFIMTSPYSYV